MILPDSEFSRSETGNIKIITILIFNICLQIFVLIDDNSDVGDVKMATCSRKDFVANIFEST